MTLALLSLLGGCNLGNVVSVERDEADVDEDVMCADITDRVLVTGFEDSLNPDGCRYAVSATDAEGSVRLLLDVPAFASAASGESVSVTYTLPDDTVRLEVDLGCALGVGECGEETADGLVDHTYTPTAGTLGVDLTVDGDEADAVLTFSEVTLVDEFGDSAILDTTWEVRLYPLE